MPLVRNKARESVTKLVSRRYSYRVIAEWILENCGFSVDQAHIYRIGNGERSANAETEKALVLAARRLK